MKCMTTETAPDKQYAHELIERLSASQISTAVRFLEFMLVDPVARAVAAAPPDDEPVTGEDHRRFLEGQAWFRQRGSKGVPMAGLLAEFDLKQEDLQRRLRRAATACIGVLACQNPRRAETVRESVRQRLDGRYAR